MNEQQYTKRFLNGFFLKAGFTNRKGWLVLVLFFLLGKTVLYAEPTARWSIPFSIVNNSIIFEYSINDIKLRLFYDTGCSFNLVESSIAEKIGITPSELRLRPSTIGGIGIDGQAANERYADSLLRNVWIIEEYSELIEITQKRRGVEIDGIAGYNEFSDHYIIEFDFTKSMLCMYDSLPYFYQEMQSIPLVTYWNDRFTHPYLCIKGIYSILDTMKLKPDFIIDTGSNHFLFISSRDTALINKMVDYRKKKKIESGENAPTSFLTIPSLLYKKPLSDIRIYHYKWPIMRKNNTNAGSQILSFPPKTVKEDRLKAIEYKAIEYSLFDKKIKNPLIDKIITQFVDSDSQDDAPPITGYLGVPFLMQYDKVVFDLRNKKAYFYKQ